MYNPEEIGIRIKKRRAELDLTLDEIAAYVGVSKSTIQRYENGLIGRIKLPVVESIADALRVSPDWLIGISTEKTAVPKDDGLSHDECSLLDSYRKLNADGQEKLIDYADDLVSSGKYIKSNQSALGAKA